jgi:hypothetical protein
MSSILQIEGNEYHPATVAAKQFGYTKEYLLMLAKQGKVDGRKVANKWYIKLSSAEEYFTEARGTQEERRRAVSEARKRELHERNLHRVHNGVRTQRINRRTLALAETAAVVVIGLTIGVTGYMGGEVGRQQASLASAGDFVDAVALSLYRAIVPEPRSMQAPTAVEDSSSTHVVSDAPWAGSLVHSPARAVQESFSDTVAVIFNEADPSVAVVTPFFKTGAGEPYRFLLTPVESVFRPEDTQ